MLILKDEHAIDVLKSGNTGHLWHDFHAIGVHATDVGHPDDDDDDASELRCGASWLTDEPVPPPTLPHAGFVMRRFFHQFILI